MSLTIVSAADSHFRTFARHSLRRAAMHGHEAVFYDLGGLGFGTPHHVGTPVRSTSVHKPPLLARHAETARPFVYLDADAFLLRPFTPPEGRYDLAVTVRRRAETRLAEKMGWINAGVLVLRPSARLADFLRSWSRLTAQVGDDQIALNRLLNPGGQFIPHHTTFEAQGVTAHALPTDDYNYYYVEQAPPGPNAVVAHLKASYLTRALLSLYVDLTLL